MRENADTLIKEGKVIAFYHMKPKPLKKGSRSSITKESFQVRHVYNGNANRIRVRRRTLLQLGGE